MCVTSTEMCVTSTETCVTPTETYITSTETYTSITSTLIGKEVSGIKAELNLLYNGRRTSRAIDTSGNKKSDVFI